MLIFKSLLNIDIEYINEYGLSKFTTIMLSIKRSFKNKKTFIPLLLLVIANVFLLFIVFVPFYKIPTVIITDTMVSPAKLKIKFGDSVRFINKGHTPHWIASDNHPTHELYPEFDTKKPLKPGEKWVFTFKKLGEIEFHDHLDPTLTGNIIVGGYGEEEYDNSKKTMLDAVKEQTEKYGASFGYAFMVKTYPNSYGAHDVAHYSGKMIYKEEGLAGIGSCDDSYGYGCYHGFVEQLIAKDGITKIKDLITTCDNLPSSQKITCHHGIGHGLLPYNKYSIIDSLNSCDAIVPQDYQRNCYSGVFMENANRMYSSNDNNKISMCDNLDNKYKADCYQYLSTILLSSVGLRNYEAGFKLCTEIADSGYIDECIKGIGGNIAQRSPNNLDEAKNNCAHAKGEHKYSCIIAVGETMMTYKGDMDAALKGLCSDMPPSWKRQCEVKIRFQAELNNNSALQ